MKGDGTLYRRGKVWWMQIYRNGRAFAMSCGTTVKEEAKTKLRAELQKSKTQEWLSPEARRVTIGELVQDALVWYRTHANLQEMADDSESRWNLHLRPIFEFTRADLFGSDHQRKYRAARLAEGDSSTTVNRELQVIRKAYKLAAESEPPKVARVPKFYFTREDNARKVFIDSDTTDKLKRAAAQLGLGPRTLLEMAFTYGWRKGELEGLCVRDIDLVDGAVRLEHTKNGEAREVPITPALRVLLQGLVAGRPADAKLFPYDVDNSWRHICKRAGVQQGKGGGIVFHDIRRSSARNKRAAGVGTSIIMQMQGWKTEGMFRRYAITDRGDMLRALEQEAASATVPLQYPPDPHAN